MISTEVQAAVTHLQQQVDPTKSAQDVFDIDRSERALDELLRDPTSTKPWNHQVRKARSHASDVLKARKRMLGPSLDDVDYTASPAVMMFEEPGYEHILVMAWLASTAALNERDRSILMRLAIGEDAESLAVMDQIPVKRMRERISRARRVARAAYVTEVLAA